MRRDSPESNMSFLVSTIGTMLARSKAQDAAHRPAAMRERPGDDAAVALAQARDSVLAAQEFRRRQLRREHRHEAHCDEPRGKMRDRHRDRDLHQEDRDIVRFAEDVRQEHDHAGQRARGNRDADGLRALHRAVPRFVGILLAILIDAFDDDDRVVDQHADREQQAHHRQHVKRDAERNTCSRA